MWQHGLVIYPVHLVERREHGENYSRCSCICAYKLLQYIFVNMFTGKLIFRLVTSQSSLPLGVVVENFSYIYQQRRNQTLNREEMRSFKKVWAQFDQSSTGYLDRHKIVPFLAVRLSLVSLRLLIYHNIETVWCL